MKKICHLVCLLGIIGLMARPARAQQDAPAFDKLIEEAGALYLADKNDEALALYQQADKLRPNDFQSQYGMALVYYTTRRYAESVAICQTLVARGDDRIPNLYVTYGTSLDRQQKSAEAVEVYKQALQKFPTDEPLWRYQGIALTSLKQYEAAAQSFQQAVLLKPLKSSAHLLLIQVYGQLNQRVPALMACVRGLMLEPASPRAVSTTAMLDALMRHGVRQTGDKQVSVNMPAGALEQATKPTGKPDDFAQADVTLTFEAALDYDAKHKNTAPTERFAEKFAAFCQELNRAKPAHRLGFNWQFYAPFFIELEQKGHVPALAYSLAAMRTDVSPDVSAWLTQHPQQVQALSVWAKAYQWPTK